MSNQTLPPVRPSIPEQPPVLPAPQHDGHGGGHGGDEHGIPADLQTPSSFAIVIAVGTFVALLAVLFLVGWIPSHAESNSVREEAADRAKQLPQVSYTFVSQQTNGNSHDVVLPCDIRANQSAPLFTRANGFLADWKFDAGQLVEKDQVMAIISTPDVDAQLAQSKATVDQDIANINRAKADLELAKVTYTRYIDAQKQNPGSVIQEDVDTKKAAVDDAQASLEQAIAAVAAAKADVDRLTTLVGFEQVKAPFSGKVTARKHDRGDLLSPSNTSAGSEIFDLQEIDLLRVFINVPQEYANNVKIGDKVKLFVRNFPTKAFIGEVTLTAGAVDPNTRTMQVQINFPNKDGQLLPGEYGEVHLPVKDSESIGLIPTSALIFNAQANGNQVAVVGDGNKIHMKKIATRRDFGTTIEIASGLDATDKVVTNPSERVSEGAVVDAKQTPNSSPASQPSK